MNPIASVLLSPQAEKYFKRQDANVRLRLKAAFAKLGNEPPEGDIAKLQGRDGFRLRIGGYRVLFDFTGGSILIYDIGPRGQIYNKR